MTGRELSENIRYLGMERGIRKLAISDNLAKPDDIAVMSEIEVCNLVAEKYDLVFSEDERFGLVRSEDADKLNNMLVLIKR